VRQRMARWPVSVSAWLVLLCLGLPQSVSAADKADKEKKEKRQRPPPSYPVPPDTRPKGCDAQAKDPAGKDFEGLKVSIIIPYRNETWAHIKGSLESILYNTPRRYLSEVMFVSDGNGPDNIYMDQLRAMASKTVSVLALPPPGVGLIEAKMRAVGAVATNSSVLVFLEPHIRVNRNWLQPLLRRLREHPKVLAMPALDHIAPDNFHSYNMMGKGHWRFEWNLNLVYTSPANNMTWPLEPYLSPATSGGIFAIRKDWWNSLEFYDSGMFGWGGDHLEASFKVWRCGGHIEIVPCSRIGHLFREPEDRPYNVETQRVVRNYARVAKAWLGDQYLKEFYLMKPEAKSMDTGDLSAQYALQERLKCKDMTWYLQNVDREMEWEINHICVPGCHPKVHAPQCCGAEAANGRTTLAKVMPPEEYAKAKVFSPIKTEL